MPLTLWEEALRFARRFHAQPLTEDGVGQLTSECEWKNDELLRRALTARVNCFVTLDFFLTWKPEEIAAYRSEDQLTIVRDRLADLGRLLYELSGVRS